MYHQFGPIPQKMFEITQVSIYNEKNEDSAEQRQTKLKREQTGKIPIFPCMRENTDVIANSNTSTCSNLPFLVTPRLICPL